MLYHYCITRGDIPAGLAAAQLVHAAGFSSPGGSEGHYIHVELVFDGGKRALFMLGKTFQGMEHAKTMCSRLIDLFDC